MQKSDQAKKKEFVDIGKQTYKAVFPDGSTKTVTYSEIKKHNNAIIEDNCLYCILRSVTAGSAEPGGRSAFLSGRT